LHRQRLRVWGPCHAVPPAEDLLAAGVRIPARRRSRRRIYRVTGPVTRHECAHSLPGRGTDGRPFPTSGDAEEGAAVHDACMPDARP
jgi:hypothetical protein